MAERHNTQNPLPSEARLCIEDHIAIRYEREAARLIDMMKVQAIDTAIEDLGRELRS
jgi:hypothetical protein